MKQDEGKNMDVYFGYDDLETFKQELSSFITTCKAECILTDIKPGAPDTTFVNAVSPLIQSGNNVLTINAKTVSDTIKHLFGDLSPSLTEEIAAATTQEFDVLNSKGAQVNTTQLKNYFIRTVFTLYTVFPAVLKKKRECSVLFCEGSFSRVDFIAINILIRLGIGGKVICLNCDKPDFLTKNLFTVKNGRLKDKFEIVPASGITGDLQRNEGFAIAQTTDTETCLEQLLFFIGKRANNTVNASSSALSVCLSGVSDENTFETAVNKFYLSLKSKSGVFLLDSSFGNPTYDEIQSFNTAAYSRKTIRELAELFEAFKGTDFPVQLQNAADNLLSKKANKKNHETIIKIWLLRFKVLFDNKNIVPAVIIWGGVSEKVNEFLLCLERLPVDIIQFAPCAEAVFSTNAMIIETGAPSKGTLPFPHDAKKLTRLKTVAFQAEQEIREVLSGDSTRCYQIRQFARMNPIILKTTLEEIDIIWNEPAKFRPGFSTIDNVVTIPSFFVKLSGVPEDADSYISGIRAKVTRETLLLNKLPYLSQESNPETIAFMRRIYFNGDIDEDKLKKSPYYKYSLYPKETQDVIMQGVLDFLRNDFYTKKRASFIFDILEILFNLPPFITQMINNFSFTETVPKIILYNAADTPCSPADSIMIMFLKSLGFDVLMYIPTGYRVIEEYINESLFNTINLGRYRYDLAGIDIMSNRYAPKRNPIRNIFNRKGTSK